ncbi:MAG: four helix bundle protein [candidate division WOR-3 bacterium]|nr:four helix bundle protein [candidate division WOR-3 bacterium]
MAEPRLCVSPRSRGSGPSPKIRQDLVERTARFGTSAISLSRAIKEDAVTRPLISQLVRAATSVGANYSEANEAESRSDFSHKISICAKEARETGHWVRMIVSAVPEHKTGARQLWLEARELTLIFGVIVRACKKTKAVGQELSLHSSGLRPWSTSP